jgi:hypothetical protein
MICYLLGDAESFCQFGYGGFVQSVIFEETLTLFRRGDTFPGHGLRFLLGKK